MRRVPEPELMTDPEQARAYAHADFAEPHDHFVALFVAQFGANLRGTVLDLGCGPGDICRRFARAVPGCRVHGIDAAPAMLELARAQTEVQGLTERVYFSQAHLPHAALPHRRYDALISNSLLHHLADPTTLWRSVRAFARPGACVFVMDLLRPNSRAAAEALVEQYAAGEAPVLRRDFFNSLLAAYRPPEVRRQLEQQGLDQLHVEIVSDRHFTVSGRLA